MSIFPEPTRIDFDTDTMWVGLADGRVIGVPLAWFPRLLNGTEAQRRGVFLSPSGMHWEELDEDISVAGILAASLAAAPSNAHAA